MNRERERGIVLFSSNWKFWNNSQPEISIFISCQKYIFAQTTIHIFLLCIIQVILPPWRLNTQFDMNNHLFQNTGHMYIIWIRWTNFHHVSVSNQSEGGRHSVCFSWKLFEVMFGSSMIFIKLANISNNFLTLKIIYLQLCQLYLECFVCWHISGTLFQGIPLPIPGPTRYRLRSFGWYFSFLL